MYINLYFMQPFAMRLHQYKNKSNNYISYKLILWKLKKN